MLNPLSFAGVSTSGTVSGMAAGANIPGIGFSDIQSDQLAQVTKL